MPLNRLLKPALKKFITVIFFVCSLVAFGHVETSSSVADTSANQSGQGGEDVPVTPKAFDKLQGYASRALAIQETVTNSQAFDDIVNGKEISLPARIIPPSGDENYSLVIDSINFTPTKAYAVVYMIIKVPVGGETKELVFVGDKITFTRNGGFSGEKTLKLAKDVDFNVGKGSKLIVKSGVDDPSRATYVKFDCDGFEELAISADVMFSRSIMLPVDADGTVNEGYVTASFNTIATSWDDWMADLTFQERFQITNLPNFNVEASTIHYDHSDLRNPQALNFPDNYAFDASDPLWRGFYIREFDVAFPKAFHDKDRPNDPLHIGATDIIIDKTGFSGRIYAENLVHIDRGRIGSWKYSVEEIHLTLQSNSFVEGGFDGAMNLPISGEDKNFSYSAVVSKNDQNGLDYVFTVSNTDNLDFALWKAGKVTIAENSIIKIAVIQGRFSPEADLSGAMTVGVPMKEGSSKGFGATLAFEHLVLKTSSPEVSIGPGGGVSLAVDLPDAVESKLANFPIQLDSCGIKTGPNGNSLGLILGLTVNFQGEDEGGFGGSTRFTIWGKKDAATRRWGFDRVQLERIEVDVDNKAFKLQGYVEFFEGDQTYGEGFCGQIKAEFVEKLSVEVAGIFGNVDGYRYWYVDGGVTLPSPIPFIGVAGINGFSGGAFYHMSRAEEEPSIKCQVSDGNIYVPNQGTALGLKLGIGLVSMPTDNLFNGNIGFEVTFNHGGGIRRVTFYGTVELFNSVKTPALSSLAEQINKLDVDENGKPKSKPDYTGSAQVAAQWETYYDVPTKTFEGNFKVFVNVAGGLLKGSNGNNKAGEIAIFVSPDDWYLYVGKPAEMIGIDFAGIAQFNAYFVAGTKLPRPAMGPIPPEVSDKPSDFINEDMMAIGSGLAFGSRVDFRLRAGKSWKITPCSGWVGAEFRLMFGFDLLLTKSQAPVKCAQAKNGERGIKDWYAFGQAYAYLSARLGIDYKCLIKSGTWNLASFTASVLMQAQLPNPSYFRGEAKVDIDLLGLVRLKKNIDFDFGDRCGVGDPADIRVISQLTPLDSVTGADVYTKPMVYLKLSNHHTLFLAAENKTVRVHIDDENVSLKCKTCEVPNSEVEGEMKWSEDEMQFMFMPFEALEGLQEYEFEVSASLQEQKSAGEWVMYGSNEPVEVKKTTFFTAIEEDNIPTTNIAYAYPLPHMKNFYKEESNQGYIRTLVLPHKPLRLPPGYEYEMRWKSGSSLISSSRIVEVKEQRGVNQIEFTIPTDKMGLNKDYRVELFKVPSSSVSSGSGGSTASATEVLVLAYSFHSSAFGSFTEKMSKIAAQNTNVFDGKIEQSLSAFGSNTEGLAPEEVAAVTVQGIETADQLIILRPGNIPKEFKDGVEETIYASGNEEHFTYKLEERSNPPYDALYFVDDFDGVTVSYEIPFVVSQDKVDLKHRGNISFTTLPEWKAGKYTYFMDYYLPGGTVPVATVPMSFYLDRNLSIE